MAAIPSDPECKMSIPFIGINTRDLLAFTKAKLRENQGDLRGDEQSGTISTVSPVTTESVYRVRGNVLDVFVTEKPLIVSCGVIESNLRKGVKLAIAQAPRTPEPPEIEDEDDDEVELPTPPKPTPPDSEDLEPTDGTLPARPSVVMSTSAFQKALIAAGAKKDPRLTDGVFGSFTRATARTVFQGLGFSNVTLNPLSRGRKVQITPVAAAEALKSTSEKKAKDRRGLILASLVGIVAITGFVFFRRRQET